MKSTGKKLLAWVMLATLLLGALSGVAVAESAKPKITVAIYDRGNVPASEGTIIENRWTQWINENAPVAVEFVAIPRNTSGEKYSALFASGTAPDLIEEFSVANMNTFYTNKLLMPLNDLIEANSTEYKALLEKYPALKDSLTKEDGQMYTFGVVYSAGTNHYLVIRTDWLANLGLEIPTTVEEFVEVCRAFTFDDPDGNGEDDTYALSLSGTTGSVLTAMYGGMGDWKWDWNVTQEGVTYRWDWAQEYVTLKKQLYDMGCVDKDYATDTDGTKANQDFQTGKIGIYAINGGRSNTLGTLTTLVGNIPEADFAAMALPPTVAGSFSPAGGNFLQSNAAINAKAKDPEAVMAYVDWLNNTDTILNIRYGGDEYSHVDETTGAYVPNDPEVFKTEVSYNGDFHMTASKILDPYNDILPFDLSDPMQQRAHDIIVAADRIYLDPGIRHKQLFSYPPLSQELALVQANIGTQIDDIYTRAILSGDSYTVEQAMADAKAVFEQSGGDMITAYYDEFVKANPHLVIDDAALADMLPAYLK